MLAKSISVSFIIINLLLSACSGQFHCAPQRGVRCKSVSEVNRMVDEGILPYKTHQKRCQQKHSCFKKGWFLSKNEREPSTPKTLAIWLAPFCEASGINHSEAYLEVALPEPIGAD